MEITLRYTKGWNQRPAEVSSVEDIYKIRKEDFQNIPVFQQPESNSGNVGTSPSQPIRYHTYLGYYNGLGQLQQVMSHRNTGIYQAYINQKVQCDTVAAFIGRPSKKALISAATHMSRYVDP
ncbi:hypothetical protein V8F06_007028 [Rhypophila decipiens]